MGTKINDHFGTKFLWENYLNTIWAELFQVTTNPILYIFIHLHSSLFLVKNRMYLKTIQDLEKCKFKISELKFNVVFSFTDYLMHRLKQIGVYVYI